jgi:NTE family protein
MSASVLAPSSWPVSPMAYPARNDAIFILDRSHSDPFEPDLLLRPAFGEFTRRLIRMPELMQDGCSRLFLNDARARLFESFTRLSAVCRTASSTMAPSPPMSRLFSRPGRTDDFRKLGRQFFVVATELDNGKSAPFGSPASTTCRFPSLSRRAPPCRASIRRRGSTDATMSTVR